MVWVPERKERTRQPVSTEKLSQSGLTSGLIFLSNGASLSNQVTNTLCTLSSNTTLTYREYAAYKSVTATTAKITFSNTLTNTGQTEYSFACMFKWSGGGSGTNQYLVTRHAGTAFIVLSLPAVGSTIALYWGSTSAAGYASHSFTPVAGQYYLVTASTPAAGSSTYTNARLYVNGVLVSPSTGANGSTYSAANTDIVLAGRPADNLRVFDGEIALAGIWDRVLKPEEHLALAQNPWQLFGSRRTWIRKRGPDSTGSLRVPFTKSDGSADNIYLDASNKLYFEKAGDNLDPIDPITV